MVRVAARHLACMTAAMTMAALTGCASEPGTKTAAGPGSRPAFQGAGRSLLPEGVADAGEVYIIPIRGEITSSLYRAVNHKLAKARAAGAKLVVFDMDTLGGEITVAWKIADLIRPETAKTPTICYVRRMAISAGALIALACGRIVLSDGGVMGDCMPTVLGGTLEGVEREKIESALRAKFRSLAEANGYSPALAQSMVSAGLEVWKLRHKATGQIRYALSEDEKGRVDVPPGKAKGESNMASPWQLVEVTVPAGRVLTMAPSQAVELGFAAAVVPADPEKPMANLMIYLGLSGNPVYMDGGRWDNPAGKE